MPETHVIVGAGLAGAKAAEALRAEGFEGRLVLVGQEAELPYERPPLSKEYLRGESPREQARVHPAGFYAEQDIELRTATTARQIDTGACQVELDDGERIGFDRLLLATGATPRRLSVPGSELPGIHYLRDLEDADQLAAQFAQAGRVVVIGAGWIGAEVAASARQLGLDVSLVEMAQVPLERVLGSEVGGVYAHLHRDHGVDLHAGVALEAFEGSHAVERVRLASGRTLECDLVVAGIGVVPRAEPAAEAGLDVSNGVVVNERLETSVPGVFAAGDVANAFHPLYGRHVRVEHWANAVHQPEIAARAMLGKPASYDRLPYFFSDQYDFGMEYTGLAASWDEVVFRGDPAAHEFIAFWLDGGRVVAAMNANIWGVTDALAELISSGHPVEAARLCDPEVPLEELARRSVKRGAARLSA